MSESAFFLYRGSCLFSPVSLVCVEDSRLKDAFCGLSTLFSTWLQVSIVLFDMPNRALSMPGTLGRPLCCVSENVCGNGAQL